MFIKLCIFFIFLTVVTNGHFSRKRDKIRNVFNEGIIDYLLPPKHDFIDEEQSYYQSYEHITPTENPVNESKIFINCSEGQSSYNENDLNDIIEHFAKEMNLVGLINASYFELALSLRDKNQNALNDFLTRFENRPKHVDHLLDDLTQTRVYIIQPLVNEVISKIPELQSLESTHNQHQINSNILLEKLENFKQICKLNCGQSEESKRAIHKKSIKIGTSPSEDIYYCATIRELSSKIKDALSQFHHEYAEVLQNRVREVDCDYAENIDVLKSKLKEKAVQEFGATMYDVLSLQDEYNHYLSLLRGKNGINALESQLTQIRKINLQIDYKLQELKNEVEKYRKYCLSCGGKQNLRQQRDVEEPSHDLLDKLIEAFVDGVRDKFDKDHLDLFHYLNDLPTDKDSYVQKALLSLQPIKNEIQERVKKEGNELNDIKRQAPESLLENLSVLNENSIELKHVLNEALAFVLNYHI